MTDAALPFFILKGFIEGLRAELGPDTLSAVFEKAGLPMEWIHPARITGLDQEQAAQVYARLQAAMRVYYGRGARGLLYRIGSALWERVLQDAPLAVRAQSKIVRGLPGGMRPKAALEVLARLLSVRAKDVTVHTQDLDLLVVDHLSPTSVDQQHESAPICYVTEGLVRECLFWAAGREFDIEETSCRAMGAKECEFTIVTGARP